MRTRFTLAALVAAIAVLLTACGGGGSDSASDLARVKEAGVLKVGTEGTYCPFSYHDPKTNTLIGYDVEVAAAVGEEARREGRVRRDALGRDLRRPGRPSGST